MKFEETIGGLYLGFDKLLAADLPEREQVMSCVYRGEVTELVSVTDVGKSTLMLNLAISLVTSNPFPPLVTSDHAPVKVLYIDCEAPASALRDDAAKMRQKITNAQTLDTGLLLWVDGTIMGEPLSLDNSEHIKMLGNLIRRHGVGLVVIDTVSSAFTIQNENDNAIVKARIMGPLVQLARQENCAIVFCHHVGKPGENGHTREKAYLGRGASAFGALSRTVFTLERDSAKGEGYVKLTCAKTKGPRFDPVLLYLNQETRWFEAQRGRPTAEPAVLTVSEIDAWTEQVESFETREFLEAFKGRGSERILKERLKEASDLGLIVKTGHGKYQSAKCSAYSDCTTALSQEDSIPQVEAEL